MRRILKDILTNKGLFSMLFIGFTLTILPILIAVSTRQYYNDRFYDSKSGHFEYYYSVKLSRINIDFNSIQDWADSSFEKSSVITETIITRVPGVGLVDVVGLVNNKNWTPPLSEGEGIEDSKDKSILAGGKIAEETGTIKLFDKEYTIKGICGVEGYEYNYKMYIPIKMMPDEIGRSLKTQSAIQMIVRGDENPQEEINSFVSKIRENNENINIDIVNEKDNYERERKANRGVKEVLNFPLRLFIIALINCIIVNYLWVYIKRKEISIKKALGASNLNLFSYIGIQFIICSVFSALFAILIQGALSQISNITNYTGYRFSLDFSHVIISMIVVIGVSFVSSIIPVINILRIQPAQALKE